MVHESWNDKNAIKDFQSHCGKCQQHQDNLEEMLCIGVPENSNDGQNTNPN